MSWKERTFLQVEEEGNGEAACRKFISVGSLESNGFVTVESVTIHMEVGFHRRDHLDFKVFLFLWIAAFTSLFSPLLGTHLVWVEKNYYLWETYSTLLCLFFPRNDNSHFTSYTLFSWETSSQSYHEWYLDLLGINYCQIIIDKIQNKNKKQKRKSNFKY